MAGPQIAFNVNMYDTIPTTVANLKEIIGYVKERLTLFKILDYTRFHFNFNGVLDANCQQYIIDKMNDCKLKNLINLLEDRDIGIEKYREIDNISHWILRLAYCRDESNCDYFITLENLWFRLRFIKLNKMKHFTNFLNSCPHLATLKMVSDQEKAEIKTFFSHNITFRNVFKIHYTYATLLVSLRKGILNKGILYFLLHDFEFFLIDKFEKNLRNVMEDAKANIDRLDQRVTYILSEIIMVLPPSLRLDNTIIDIKEIDEIAQRDFPLCMKHIHEVLRKNHDLKYNARLQYGLFLKDMGVPLSQALAFWQEEFVKTKITEDAFKREFNYYFKHLYGFNGSRIKYKGNTCEFIQNLSVPVGKPHGCPFKHWDSLKLKQELSKDCQLSTVSEIARLVDAEQYTAACCKYYEDKTGRELEYLRYPLQYYDCCRKVPKIADIEDLFN